jgi:hypothetical protein
MRNVARFVGLRVRTPEGRSAIEAAHIVDRNDSNKDDLRKRCRACCVHHWRPISA